MTGDAGTTAAASRPAPLPLAAAFAALAALTGAELLVAGSAVERAARITALAGLMLAKVGLVLAFFMRARVQRRASWLLLVAIGLLASSPAWALCPSCLAQSPAATLRLVGLFLLVPPAVFFAVAIAIRRILHRE